MDLNEIFEKESTKLVGRVLKRIELHYNDINILKDAIKEVIYEELRDLRDLLIYLQLPSIKFKTPSK